MKSIDEVIKIIGNIGIWVLDRGYDRSKNIIKELLERNISFIIRGIGTISVTRVKNGKVHLMKSHANMIKTRKRVTFFEYKLDKNKKKKS